MANIKFPPLDPADLLPALDLWTKEQIQQNGSFTISAAQAFLGQIRGAKSVQHDAAKTLVLQLNDVVRCADSNRGYTRTSCAGTPVSLATLVERARGLIDATHKPETGRRATRELTAINESQFTVIRVGAGAAAEMIVNDRRLLSHVGADRLEWVSGSGEAGRGEWQIVMDVMTWSDREALDAYVKKNGSAMGWTPKLNAEARKKQVGGLRMLLDLSATHGLIPRGGAVPDVAVPAATWQPEIASLNRQVRAAGTVSQTSHNVTGGLTLLALYATRLGFTSSSVTDWEAVRARIEADADRLTASQFSNARYVFNGLVEAKLVEARVWEHREHRRLSAFEYANYNQAGEELDFSQWRLKSSGEFPTALVEGPFGLKAYGLWTRLAKSELAANKLPPRLWVNPTPGQMVKAAKKQSLFRLKPHVLASRLRSIGQHLGWLAARKGIDWTTADLAVACNPDYLEEHRKERGKASRDTTLARVAQDLAVIASPFLQAQAEILASAATARGDTSGAAEYTAASQRFLDWGTRLRVLYYENESSKTATAREGEDSLSARDVARIWEIWTADGRSGWHKLRILRDHCIDQLELMAAELLTPDADPALRRSAGTATDEPRWRATVADQVRALRSGVFRPTLEWAMTLRDVALLTLVHRIPLRPKNVSVLSLDDWIARRSDGRPGERWEGAVQIQVAGEVMKSGRVFEPHLITRDDIGDADVTASVRPDVWELWFMPNGGRDEMLRLPNGCEELGIAPGGLHLAPWVFPAPARKGHTRGETLLQRLRKKNGVMYKRGSYARHLKALITRHADILGLDVAALAKIHGAMTGHIVRHLFGSHHCDTERWPDAIGLMDASKMLAHANVQITQDRYIGKTEANISIGRVRRTQPAAEMATTVAPTVEVPANDKIAGLRADLDAGRISQTFFETMYEKLLIA